MKSVFRFWSFQSGNPGWFRGALEKVNYDDINGENGDNGSDTEKTQKVNGKKPKVFETVRSGSENKSIRFHRLGKVFSSTGIL